ncbi:MAG: hypothetical protein A2W52_03595 [Candidatus Taylorbacteria bacterium RIFCSPHIGHO2_02_49_25]|uniref:Uncharacterized protein n=1 Tax=Candidatus Taylorbacteria bacterium RIFCSPHIGHO2_02_49_25 TaxID=1802305 RepID=A0A1G2MIK1_9BACT|nr:MAG: hypothetical protein A2759_00360 [Candidatus Taylorbacteria bacterium RIFCSPHIGHO2_01_FULL_49_60]OHA23554.1 MAG: hypothetical protein A2W52_03595 [Candidatus Taylorbacteria bacterium RIFCSPHIGHO2_02_49_25]OHA36973.1 MAG: hypothetical protein A2W65_04190 [Candidatus Taylorbacteria bacterium RIFCSPLOWO2_02_50_13]OHA47302.1 MAG: hypothetical protein A3G61_04130 [Candidatus Taylorbacteria bacterium RIFCSPLOWO2_12_FULL_49_67]HCB35082.1 hypothetical protein [Candidatus Taylorbacteria bacteriu
MNITNSTNSNVFVMSTATDYIKEEVAEILGPFNKWVTGEEVGHSPSSEECFEHWRKNGGRKRFCRTHTVAA